MPKIDLNLSLNLVPPSIPIPALPTPTSLFDNPLEQQLDALHLAQNTPPSLSVQYPSTATSTSTFPTQSQPEPPIMVAFLPNKGRCYLATRPLQAQERIFIAESYGTVMCDPWLDCGICHDCWGRIPSRKSQIQLPQSKKSRSKRAAEDTIMVFCNEACWRRYGPLKADLICQVEEKIRRSWEIKQLSGPNGHWRIQTAFKPTGAGAGAGVAIAIVTVHSKEDALRLVTHYSTLIPQALAVASTSLALSKLQDQDLTLFLNCVWNALDSLVGEQESFLGNLKQQQQHESLEQKFGIWDKRAEALYPMLAKFLLEGNIKATIDSSISDDDCETIRLLTDILYRRQVELDQINVQGSKQEIDETVELEREQGGPRGAQPTFADLCSMQSNELVVFRQQLQEDALERGAGADPMADGNVCGRQDKTGPWRELLSILPSHLLSCFYVYLRIRDVFFLLDVESTWSPAPRLTIDSTLYRAMLYREVANSFGVRDGSDELLAFAIFPRASYFNHSCRPNVEKRRAGRHFEYWTTVPIKQGEECCISYGDIVSGRIERQRRLEDMYFFHCNCTRCLEEEAAESK